MSQELRAYIAKICLNEHLDFDKIISHFETLNLAKGECLLTAGEVCKQEAFILKGCIKTYYIDKNGFEIILTFATENWWACDLVSFQNAIPSNFFMECIEPCELLVLTPQKKEALLKEFPALERMFRLLVEKHLATYQRRIYENFALTAEERYSVFKDKYPALQQRIPQYLIASYLGVSPEFLSRIRGKKIKK